LPWTNAQYQQLLGRLIRKGQKNADVHVYIIKATIGGYPYDELKLKRIQFRLNNRINNEKSESTHHRMLKDATEWEEYHRQYREARKTWPIIPYEEIVMRIKQLSPRLMIGDFGCGEAKIHSEFGDRVYSFDYIAINNKVTACDMKSTGLLDEAIDIAIFSLSLMGRN
jgi:Hypothetical methyltransferase